MNENEQDAAAAAVGPAAPLARPVESADVWEAKLAIMARVGYVQKSGKVKKKDTGTVLYTFAGEKDLLRAVRPLLIRERVTMTCRRIESWPGAPTHLVRAKYTFVFRHAPSRTEDRVVVLGEGGDSGDKCCPKANTIAAKYALRIWLQLETGDDPDRSVQDGRDRPERAAKQAGPSAGEPDGNESFQRCKQALKQAPNLKTLDRYRQTYQSGRSFSQAQVAWLDTVYQDRKNALGGRSDPAAATSTAAGNSPTAQAPPTQAAK